MTITKPTKQQLSIALTKRRTKVRMTRHGDRRYLVIHIARRDIHAATALIITAALYPGAAPTLLEIATSVLGAL